MAAKMTVPHHVAGSSSRPRQEEIYIIADNLSAHKTMRVKEFLHLHPNVELHFTPMWAKLGKVRRGRGRKPSIPAEKVAAIVHATLHETPPGHTHWSCRTMAKAQGVSPDTVQRIWSGHGLKPHLVKTFKLSNDPRFEEKLTDVVGLYLNPPEKAIVLCVDE